MLVKLNLLKGFLTEQVHHKLLSESSWAEATPSISALMVPNTL